MRRVFSRPIFEVDGKWCYKFLRWNSRFLLFTPSVQSQHACMLNLSRVFIPINRTRPLFNPKRPMWRLGSRPILASYLDLCPSAHYAFHTPSCIRVESMAWTKPVASGTSHRIMQVFHLQVVHNLYLVIEKAKKALFASTFPSWRTNSQAAMDARYFVCIVVRHFWVFSSIQFCIS
jgi:hypothetical protein